MDIKVLGSGCANCNKVEQMVFNVLAELDLDAAVEHVTDFAEIAKYGVMSTPGIVINGEVKWAGGLPSQDKVKELIKNSL